MPGKVDGTDWVSVGAASKVCRPAILVNLDVACRPVTVIAHR